MELLYASSGDLSCESPIGEFSAPLLPLSGQVEGSADTQGQVLGQNPDREQSISPSALSARPADMYVFMATFLSGKHIVRHFSVFEVLNIHFGVGVLMKIVIRKLVTTK